jgi:hypothetical protein
MPGPGRCARGQGRPPGQPRPALAAGGTSSGGALAARTRSAPTRREHGLCTGSGGGAPVYGPAARPGAQVLPATRQSGCGWRASWPWWRWRAAGRGGGGCEAPPAGVLMRSRRPVGRVRVRVRGVRGLLPAAGSERRGAAVVQPPTVFHACCGRGAALGAATGVVPVVHQPAPPAGTLWASGVTADACTQEQAGRAGSCAGASPGLLPCPAHAASAAAAPPPKEKAGARPAARTQRRPAAASPAPHLLPLLLHWRGQPRRVQQHHRHTVHVCAVPLHPAVQHQLLRTRALRRVVRQRRQDELLAVLRQRAAGWRG